MNSSLLPALATDTVSMLADVMVPVDNNSVETWIEGLIYDPLTGKLIFSVLLFLVLKFIVGLVKQLATRKIQENTLRYKVRKTLDIALFIVFAIGLSVVFSDRLGNVTVAFGVVGAGVAFALQEMIASVASWFSISFGRTYRPGDRISFNGIYGDVIDIGLLRTTLMECGGWINGDLYTGRIVRVSNNTILKSPLYNYNMDFPFLWDEMLFPVRYGSDIQLARKIFEEVAEAVVGDYSRQAEVAWKKIVQRYRIEDAQVNPLVTLTADENWVSITLRYVVDYRQRRSTKDKLYSLVLEKIDASDGKVNIAGAAFEIVDMPDITINHVAIDSDEEENRTHERR